MVFYRILIILNCSVKTIFAIKPFFLSPKTPFLPRKISNHFTGVSIPAFPPERKPYGRRPNMAKPLNWILHILQF